MDRPRRSLLIPVYDESIELERLQTSYKKRITGDSTDAESKMRKRHQEEAAEMARLNNEPATLKSDIVVTAQLSHKVEKLNGHIKVLEGIKYDLMVKRARHCDSARKMQKSIQDTKKEMGAIKTSVEDAKNGTEAMKTRLEDMRKVYNEILIMKETKRCRRNRLYSHFWRRKKLSLKNFMADYLDPFSQWQAVGRSWVLNCAGEQI